MCQTIDSPGKSANHPDPMSDQIATEFFGHRSSIMSRLPGANDGKGRRAGIYYLFFKDKEKSERKGEVQSPFKL